MRDALLDDGGQALGEYAVVLAFLVILCIAAVSYVGTQLAGHYHSIDSAYP